MTDSPNYRLTVRRGVVRAIDWNPWLPTCGPLNTLMQARGRAGVAIADATVLFEDDLAAELIVSVLAGDAPEARAAIAGWAEDVGYRRLWIADEVRELAPTGGGVARTRCSGCALELSDGGPAFWEGVRMVG